MDVSLHTIRQTNSDTKFYAECENATTQNKSLPRKSKRHIKLSQEVKELQQETNYILKCYKNKKESISTKTFKNKRDEILNIIIDKGLSKKSLHAFNKKLLLIDEALKECQQQNDMVTSKRLTKLTKISDNNSADCIKDYLTSETSPSLLKDSAKEIEITGNSKIIAETVTQLEPEITTDHPLNLSLRHVVNSDDISKTNLNNEPFQLDLNENNDKFYNPIDLSLKNTLNSTEFNPPNKNLNKVYSNNNINRKINTILNVNILRNAPVSEIINSSFPASKKQENINVLSNTGSPEKTTSPTREDDNRPTTSISLSDEEITNKLFQTQFEIIKEEFKEKINKFFAEQLNIENPIKYNSAISSDFAFENETNKENNGPQTENIFENLWSESIETPLNAQPINYNDLQEVIEEQNLCISDGTDTNHIDIDFSVHSKLSPLTDSIYQKDIKSYDEVSISAISNDSLKNIQKKSENGNYILSEKHILRLASALNLNVDYLKLQITLCTNEYSTNNYNFDDISVIAPSQSPININQMRQLNRCQAFKIYKNSNISKTTSYLDIYTKQKYKILEKRRKKLKEIKRKCKSSEIFTNFSKR